VVAQIVWLEGQGQGIDPGEVGVRAVALSQLRAVGLPVPRGFCLGRSVYLQLGARTKHESSWQAGGKLPPDIHRAVMEALHDLGGSFAIRRSPLDETRPTSSSGDWAVTTRGGRPERETYLNLVAPAEVTEAVRRIWGTPSAASSPRKLVSIIVQRFMLPEVCALVRRDRTDPDRLHVLSSLGVGDLLAAGLVVPDRHIIRRHDGTVISSSLGRKAQMTIACSEGGVSRVPVPAASARQMAVDAPKLIEVARTWRISEEACGPLYGMGIGWSGGRWHVTSAVPALVQAQEGLMLG
jgi:rifampicin phosphotransferase